MWFQDGSNYDVAHNVFRFLFGGVAVQFFPAHTPHELVRYMLQKPKWVSLVHCLVRYILHKTRVMAQLINTNSYNKWISNDLYGFISWYVSLVIGVIVFHVSLTVRWAGPQLPGGPLDLGDSIARGPRGSQGPKCSVEQWRIYNYSL